MNRLSISIVGAVWIAAVIGAFAEPRQPHPRSPKSASAAAMEGHQLFDYSSSRIFRMKTGKNPCLPNPCQNEGSCIPDGIKYECKCDYGFTGSKCEFQTGESVNVEDGAIRLVDGGNIPYQGRIEIFHGGRWGTICDDRWTMNNAQVACKQLAYGQAKSYLRAAGFGQGLASQPIMLDNLACSGREQTLASCSHAGWEVTNCVHSEDVGVRCNGPGAVYHTRTVDSELIASPSNLSSIDSNSAWQTTVFCPDNTFVKGFTSRRDSSDTRKGLTQIFFFCIDNEQRGNRSQLWITSGVGQSIRTRRNYYCKDMHSDMYIIGVKVIFGGSGVGVGALVPICDVSNWASTGASQRHLLSSNNPFIHELNPGGRNWERTDDLLCKSGAAVCGLNTNVDRTEGVTNGRINEIRLYCCIVGS